MNLRIPKELKELPAIKRWEKQREKERKQKLYANRKKQQRKRGT